MAAQKTASTRQLLRHGLKCEECWKLRLRILYELSTRDITDAFSIRMERYIEQRTYQTMNWCVLYGKWLETEIVVCGTPTHAHCCNTTWIFTELLATQAETGSQSQMLTGVHWNMRSGWMLNKLVPTAMACPIYKCIYRQLGGTVAVTVILKPFGW